VKNAPDENLPAMVVAKLLQFIKALSARKWTDQEIVEDLSFLQDELQASFDQLTYPFSPCVPLKIHKKTAFNGFRTFDEYSSELESGHLSWTPPHHSDDFWRENAAKLTEGNNKLLKVLAKLLATSKNPLVLAVGCHDIGQLVKQVPQARSYNPRLTETNWARSVQGLGAKTRIMELMGHSDPDVRYEALSTVQLLMSGQFL
jgi:V-type H+-transporting ATPase subunit H